MSDQQTGDQLVSAELDHLDPAVAAMLGGGSFPPVPPITGLWDQLPDQSAPVIQGTTTDHLMMYADSDNSSRWTWVPDTPNTPSPFSSAYLVDYWGGYSQPEYTLTWRQYWRQVPHTYTHVLPGGGYTKTYTVTYGISETDSQSISAELGVEAGGLGAKITATFEHSMTVSQETSETTEYSVSGPADGYTRVWVLWQLVDEIVALDASGNVLPNDTWRGDVYWWIPMGGTSGAYLSYPNRQQAFPSLIFVPAQKDFPSSADSPLVTMGRYGPVPAGA